jgi:hypothetical protein
MSFDQTAVNLILMLTAAFVLLFADLFFWLRGKRTLSETVWTVNSRSLALAYIIGLLSGHFLTVPG